MSLERPRAGTPSRSASPAYRADVPHGIESGTDTEAEGEAEQSTPHSRTSNPPIPPPKDRVQVSNGENEQDSAELSPGDEALDQLQSIEHTSHSTFIAPALPPIRFSMNTADFSELLTSVGGLPSLKSLDQLAKTTTNGVNPSTPPSTASLAQDKLSSDQSSAPPRSSDRSVHQLTPTASSASLSASASDIRIVTSDTPGDADETLDPAVQKAMEAIQMAKDANSDNVKLDLQSLESILRSFETYKAESTHLKQRFERVNVRRHCISASVSYSNPSESQQAIYRWPHGCASRVRSRAQGSPGCRSRSYSPSSPTIRSSRPPHRSFWRQSTSRTAPTNEQRASR